MFSRPLLQCWQWQFGAMVIVLAWLNLLGDIRQLPYLGIYVIMFFDILKTFLRFVIVFTVFIVAFGLGFHALLVTKSVSVVLPNKNNNFPLYFLKWNEHKSVCFYKETRPTPFHIGRKRGQRGKKLKTKKLFFRLRTFGAAVTPS